MKALIPLIAAALLGGCAAFDRPAEFALERYPGDSDHERLLAKVNVEVNRHRPCAQLTRCVRDLPSREVLREARLFDGISYAMAKSYALQDAGVDDGRLRIAQFSVLGETRVALVVDERYVLDNFDDGVRRVEEYRRLNPSFAALPERLMVAGRPGSAAVGR
jgi:predicted transglutaminase-like cysteine proteinase